MRSPEGVSRRRVAGLLAAVAVAALLVVAPGFDARGVERSARDQMVRDLGTLVFQYRALDGHVARCAGEGRQRRTAALLRAMALPIPVRASVADLRRRAAVLTRAVVALSQAARRCATAPAPRTAAIPVHGTVGPSSAGTVTGTRKPDGTAYRAPLTLRHLINGEALRVASTLGPLRLPSGLEPRDASDLAGPACGARNAVCVGFDRTTLARSLARTTASNLLLLLLRDPAGNNVSGVSTDIAAALHDGGLRMLIRVQRVGDRTLRLVPVGPLAELGGLPDVQNIVIGTLQAVR
jgi:hypothetical protein